MRRVHLFDLSEPADPRLVTEMWIDEVEKVALGRRATRAVSRHRGLEGRPATRDRFYLHTYGNRYSDGWPTDYAFQSVDVTDLEEPVWLGRWHMDLPYPMPSDEQLEAVGEVGVFAATFGGWYAPCETQFATWIAEADSIRPVEWRLTNDTVVAMETYGASLLLTNTCMPHSICDNWLSAYEITGDGYLAALPAHRCWDWVHCARAVTDPTGVFYVSQYYWDLVFTATAVAIDAEGELETRRAPRNLLRDDCGPEIAPIRGALVAACWNNVLRIKPTEYVEAPVLLGDWVDGGARKIESIRPTRLPPS